MPQRYAEAAQKLAVGEISDPVRTELGWQVIKVTETTASANKPFRDVRLRVQKAYRREARNQRWQEMIKTLRQEYGVEVHPLPAGITALTP